MFIYQNIPVDYEVCGSGTPLLFLHGWGGNRFSLCCLTNALKERHTCITLSFPPFGESGEPKEPWSLANYREMVKDLLDELHLEKVTILAHSFGGRVAINLASVYTDRVEKLVLFSSAGMKPRRSVHFYLKVWKYKILKRFNQQKAQQCGSPDWRLLSPIMKKTFSNIVNTFQEKDCKKVVCPTLLIWGEKDRETPVYMAKRMQKHLRDCGLWVHKNAGHFAYLTEANKNIAIIKRYLER